MKLEIMQIPSLTLDPNNARTHDTTNLEAIAGSLTQFGQRKPIVIDKNNVVVAGNGTVTAAKSLGWTEIQAVRVPADWDADRIKAFALADNRTAELANWNQQILTDQLRELELLGFDVVELGFELPEIQVEEEPLDEEIPELPDNPVTVPGDLWKLGEHYLLCGDSTKTSDYEILMQGELADIVVTDPPWNVNYGAVKKGNPMGYKQRTIMNDHMGEDDWASFVDGFTSNFSAFSKPGAPLYCVMSPQEWPVIDDSLRRAGFHWSSTIIWAKDSLVLSRKDYHTQYEPIWYGWNSSGPRLVELKDRKQSDLWQVARPKRSELHPTTKPVELIARALQNSSKRGDLLLEPFGGSGSHLIAAEQTNRRCRAMELDPKYCDVIVKRWETLTGQKAELVNASR
jgi:DNA modification methylase